MTPLASQTGQVADPAYPGQRTSPNSRRNCGCVGGNRVAWLSAFGILMPQLRAIHVVLPALLGGWLAPPALLACNVPVFRYALERWTPDPYVAVVFYREPLPAEQQNLVGALEKSGKDGGANLLVLKANVAGEMSAPLRALWRAQPQPVLPWLVVRYPAQTGIEQKWGQISTIDIQCLTSPSDRGFMALRYARHQCPLLRQIGSYMSNVDSAEKPPVLKGKT
jgi:hypothetical protein